MEALRIALVAGALIVPAFGQSGAADPSGSATPGSAGSGSAATAQTAPGSDMNRTDRGDHDFNFGWLGLVGLAGLLGLRRPHSTTYDSPRDINNTGPSGVR